TPTRAQLQAASGRASVTHYCSPGLVATGTVDQDEALVRRDRHSLPTRRSSALACGNTGTATQTLYFNRDTVNPVITLADPSSLDCNPTRARPEAALGAASVSDSCSPGLVATGTVDQDEALVGGCRYSLTKSWTV